jgi:hypothetical protein
VGRDREGSKRGWLGSRSGGATLVVSLKTADIRELDDLPQLRRLHGAMVGRVQFQGPVNPPPIVEIDVASHEPAQVPLVKDNDVVQAFSTERPDNPFGVGILPRTPRCGGHFLDVKAAHPPAEDVTVDAIAIANQVLGRGVKGKGLDHLLCGPLHRRMRSDVKMDDASAFMGEHDQGKQNLQFHGRHHEEVDRDEFPDRVGEKRLPGRRWRAVCTDPVFLHGRLRS